MNIYYENSNGIRIDLDRAPYKMLSETSLFDYEWEYATKNNMLKNISKSVKSKDVKIAVSGKTLEEYNKNSAYLYEILDIDLINKMPGKLYIGDYYIPCLFYKNTKDTKYANVKQAILSFSIIPDSENWIRENNVAFTHVDIPDPTGKGYPYGYEYDYTRGKGYVDALDNVNFSSCDFILTIKGYVRNPYIKIGSNIYQVYVTVSLGDLLQINTKEKTIVLIKSNGIKENVFAKRDRINYIFSSIPTGKNQIYWNSPFDFDITLLEKRGVPKWI